ncbi:MAG: tetratricopeptide repeat protein [Leptospiraceae bacterium]|nr:tetratricopeptide repeat protein [Leptospiraceae bacterium]
MNKELFEYLLSQPESDTLDFKSEFYDFSGDTEKAKEAKESKFIKDIISFANTKKDKSSYIIVGIKENETTKEKEFLGVIAHPDDANLQEKIKDKVYPVPEFLYYPYTYKNQQFGIIEILIPKYSEEPYYCKKDYIGGLLKSELYFRRGSSNAEATPEEERHIREWFKSLKNQSPNSDKPPKTTKELTNIPDIILEDVIGREKELSAIFEYFQKNERPLVVTAIGGIGKSTLTRAYIKKFRSQYQNIIWIDVTGSFQSSIVSNHTLLHNLKIELPKPNFDLLSISNGIIEINKRASLPNEEKRSNYDIVLNAIRKIQGKNLLILDNAESNLSSEKVQLPTHPNWDVLATSREKIEGFSEYPLEYLSKESAIQLFKKYSGDKGSDSEIEKLVELVKYHTLTIELLAKTLKESLEIDSVVDLHNILISHQLDDESLQYKIQTDHSKQEIELYSYLFQVFDSSKLEADNFSIPVLKQICLFPPDFLPASIFIELLESDKISKKDIAHTLKYLSKKGWLEENNKDFKIHKIIKEVLWYKLKPVFEDCWSLVRGLEERIEKAENKNAKEIEYYADIILSISEYFDNIEFVFILCLSSMIHLKLKKYSKTIEGTTRILKLVLLIDGEEISISKIKQQMISTAFGTRALSYFMLNEYEESKADYSKAISYDKENASAYFGHGYVSEKLQKNQSSNENFQAIISISKMKKISNSLIGMTYKKLNNYEELLRSYSLALRENDQEIGVYASRALIYLELQKYDAAIQDLTSAISINENFIEAYNIRGLAYETIKKYENAIADYSSSLQLEENDLITYFARGMVYIKTKQYEKAMTDFSKGLLLDSDNVKLYSKLAHVLFLTGKQKEAVEAFDKALSMNPEDQTILVELWFYAYAHIPERREEAEEKLTELIQNGAKSEDWDFAPNIEKAITDGHPDSNKLKFFVEKITGISFR